MSIPNVLYRYADTDGVVCLQTHYITKRTAKGCWVGHLQYGEKHFILDSGVKRYAYPTKEEAKTSFLARKRRQLAILKHQVKAVEHAVIAAKEDRFNDYATRDAYFAPEFDLLEF